MIISNGNVVCIPLIPSETYAPLVIDSNTMLVVSAARKLF